MIIRRRTWLYRLTGQALPQRISFDQRMTAAMVRKYLRSTVGNPIELWGRSCGDVLRPHGTWIARTNH